MSTHTDSVSTTHHEDGSYTTVSEITYTPPTRNEKIVAGAVLGALVLAPTAPLLFIVALEKAEYLNEKRKEKKAARKALKSV